MLAGKKYENPANLLLGIAKLIYITDL